METDRNASWNIADILSKRKTMRRQQRKETKGRRMENKEIGSFCAFQTVTTAMTVSSFSADRLATESLVS